MTISSSNAADCVNRQFHAPRPNALYLAALRLHGFRDRRPCPTHCRLAGFPHGQCCGFILDALEQALHDRRSVKDSGLVHRIRRRRYNALAETITDLYKTEVIQWRDQLTLLRPQSLMSLQLSRRTIIVHNAMTIYCREVHARSRSHSTDRRSLKMLDKLTVRYHSSSSCGCRRENIYNPSHW
jgi:hypothetical protein